MRRVIVMSGVSGSGKSTWTKNFSYLRERYVEVVSADFYFMKDGVYAFNPAEISNAHGSCFRKFIEHLNQGVPYVIVDNTNTSVAEIAPYILGAQAYEYDAEIVTIMCESEDDVKCAAERNKHGVPFAGVTSQHKALRERQLMPWWKNTSISFQKQDEVAKMSSRYRIELDIAGEFGYEKTTPEWAEKFGCRAELITHNGPAGGNPLYVFFGEKDALEALFRDYCAQSYPSVSAEKLKYLVNQEVEELFRPEVCVS